MAKRWTFSPDPAVEAALAALEKTHPPLFSPGIARIVALLEKLGRPHLSLPPTFHAAGTNGKGSALAFLQAIFEAGGLSVHKYTSPHLVRFEERMALNGRDIAPAQLLPLIEECAQAAAGLELSFFEFGTALAFLAASRAKADVFLLETGLGGTSDCTNVVPETSGLITRISFDHMNVLGNTLAEIASNKAGIMRPGCPCVIARQFDDGVMKVFGEHAARTGATLFRHGHEWNTRLEKEGFAYESAAHKFHLPVPALKGAHQVDNAGAAIAALERSPFSHLLKQDILEKALKNVNWPGRLQRLTSGPVAALLPPGWELWLDGAHNDSGAETLAAQAKIWDEKPLHLVTAMKEDKDARAFYRYLAPHLQSVTITEEDVGMPMMPAAELCDQIRSTGIPDISTAETLESAVRALVFKYDTPQRILVAGSLYLAGNILRTHH